MSARDTAPRLTALALAIVTATGLADAQVATRFPFDAQRTPAPALPPSKARITALTRTIALPPLPDAMVQLQPRPNFTVGRTPPPGLPPYAVYVARRGRPPAGEMCSTFIDRIDLRTVRGHGYTLVDAKLTGTIPMIASDTPYRLVGLDDVGNRLAQGTPFARFAQIEVTSIPQPDRDMPSNLAQCADTYGLTLTVTGRTTIDPLTGQTVPR